MSDKYPRIGSTERLKPTSQAKCVICGQPAKYRVDVQIDWFRGDDVVANACKEHRKNQYAEDLTYPPNKLRQAYHQSIGDDHE